MYQNVKSKVATQDSFLKKSFLVTGFGFLIICLIGFIVSFIIDGSGVLKDSLKNTTRLNFDMYKARTDALTRLVNLSFLGMGIILISSILNIVWAFRVLKASKGFIYTALSLYVLGQGIGFGILFVTWKATDLLAIFGISGGMFLIMAIIGYTSKNLLPLGKWLIIGSFFAFILLIMNMIFYFVGVYSDNFSLLLYSFLGFLVLGWIAFDVWSIKKTSEYARMVGGFDKMTEFRLVMWSGFKLLSDLVALIWIVARLYLRAR